MQIRRFRPEDAEETALLMEKTLRESNGWDYPAMLSKRISPPILLKF